MWKYFLERGYNDEEISLKLSLRRLTGGVTACADAAMTWDEALQYQKQYPKDFFVKKQKMKDAYGEKNINRYFNMLQKNGVAHSGGSFAGGKGRTTFINLILDYGFPNIPSEPVPYIRWSADLAGNPKNGYNPNFMSIAFEDGYIKKFSLQGWEYMYLQSPGFFLPVWHHNYSGRIC